MTCTIRLLCMCHASCETDGSRLNNDISSNHVYGNLTLLTNSSSTCSLRFIASACFARRRKGGTRENTSIPLCTNIHFRGPKIPNPTWHCRQAALQHPILSSATSTMPSRGSVNALHQAVDSGSTKRVRVLLSRGLTDVNEGTIPMGSTALMLARSTVSLT